MDFNPPFKIGEVYWRPHSTPKPIDVPCPTCFGSCWLTVILGDGESVRVRCDGCDKRADDWRQTGTVREYDYTPSAVRFEVAGIESMHGDQWRLRSTDGDSEYFHRLRTTEAEALAEATESARQREADRLRRELAAARNLIAVGEKQRDVLLKANTLLAAQRDAHSNARQAWQAKAEGDFAPQPTDEERQRLADMARYYGGQGASSLVYVRADDMRRIATLLEQPAPAPARKSIGRRWVVRFADGEYSTRAYLCQGDAATASRAAHGTVVLCDLVPVAEEEKP